jgi:hypothetical protein
MKEQKRDGRIRVYRHRNERFSSSCVQEVDSFGGGSVMMWAAISNDRKADLIDVVLLKVVHLHCYTRCVWPSVVLLE